MGTRSRGSGAYGAAPQGFEYVAGMVIAIRRGGEEDPVTVIVNPEVRDFQNPKEFPNGVKVTH